MCSCILELIVSRSDSDWSRSVLRTPPARPFGQLVHGQLVVLDLVERRLTIKYLGQDRGAHLQ